MPVCPACDTENPSSNVYCGQCGSLLDTSGASLPRYPDRKRLVRREIAVLATGVVAVLAALWAVWYFLVAVPSPAHVVQAFIEADRTGQLAKEQDFVTRTWDAQMALSLFQTMRRQAGSSPFQNYRILDTGRASDEGAVVNVELTLPASGLLPGPQSGPAAPGNTTMVVTFVLARRGDEWKIDSSQTLASVLSVLAAQGLQQFKLQIPPGLTLPPGWQGILTPPVSPQAPPGASGSVPGATGVL